MPEIVFYRLHLIEVYDTGMVKIVKGNLQKGMARNTHYTGCRIKPYANTDF